MKAWTSTKIPFYLARGSTSAAAAFVGASSSSHTHCDDRPTPVTSHSSSTSSFSADTSPTLPVRLIQPNENLEICFDTRTRVPLYVMERLTAASLGERGSSRHHRHGGGGGGRPRFFEDTTIEEPNLRSKLAHYKGSGYDRGHLAPAADFPHAPQDTFSLCNVVPQHHAINLTLWSQLEEWVRRVVRAETSAHGNGSYQQQRREVYVVTGPLWLPRRQINEQTFEYRHFGLGRPPSLVAVPTHLFKVVAVVDRDSNSIVQFACFVVHNHDDDDDDHGGGGVGGGGTTLKSKKLEDFLVRWTDLETVSGLQFFPGLVTQAWKDRADQMVQQQLELRDDRASPARAPLLLTNGSDKGHHNKRIKKKHNESHTDLRHLCSNGKCRQ